MNVFQQKGLLTTIKTTQYSRKPQFSGKSPPGKLQGGKFDRKDRPKTNLTTAEAAIHLEHLGNTNSYNMLK